tara:strand:- start:3662 stop:4639 length:978 start_codon:yes stop_codon:yes gene_type:complete
MNIHERANNLLEHLASNSVGNRPIVFITHSLGGILTKEMLRIASGSADAGWRKVADQTRLVIFLATPHSGASLAAIVKFAAPHLSSSYVDLLTNETGYLTSLNQHYRDQANEANITTVSYYEKYKTKNVALVVSPESADPGVGKIRPVAVDADHISICKPDNQDSLIFTSICRHIDDVIKTCPIPETETNTDASFTVTDYGKEEASDRRDLLQKLIDAGREHEYQHANNLQNKFAQRYYKLGLYTSAKADADAILASVEQRFIMHVYANQICKGASDDEIANALQSHVIDPLCHSHKADERLSPTAILQALYFLTEQCHIQWDAS